MANHVQLLHECFVKYLHNHYFRHALIHGRQLVIKHHLLLLKAMATNNTNILAQNIQPEYLQILFFIQEIFENIFVILLTTHTQKFILLNYQVYMLSLLVMHFLNTWLMIKSIQIFLLQFFEFPLYLSVQYLLILDLNPINHLVIICFSFCLW